MNWDFIIVGSGFGGSVSALRLAEKGYRTMVLEKGRRWNDEDYPTSNWDLARWLWLPSLGMRGHFQMTLMRHMLALTGVGVGGGSLVYANTLPVPGDEFFEAPSWAHLADWKRELAPHYGTAKRMLGVEPNRLHGDAEEALRRVAERRDLLRRYQHTDVAVYQGPAGVTVEDPYFDGEGPPRTGCDGCGACMVGCRNGAKNTLDRNYLYLAERRGARIVPEAEVTWIEALPGGGYRVTVRLGTSILPSLRQERTYLTRNIVLSGGVMGTVPLLLRLARSRRGLPRLSPMLGRTVRTNSEALLGVVTQRRDVDLSRGVAIGAILGTDEHSHAELVRYPAGSGFFRALMIPHAPGRGAVERLAGVASAILSRPLRVLRAYLVPDFATYTTIMLYMRTIEGTLRFRLGRGLTTGFSRGMVSDRETGDPPRAFMPEATDVIREIAQILDGEPMGIASDSVLDIPSTAHVMGGCCLGSDSDEGVVDHRHRAFGHEGLWIVDGSNMSANPGVNPSLTITALAERAMSFIPPKRST